MSTKYIQILEMVSTLSKEECIMLIKDISTALVENRQEVTIPTEIEEDMLKSALQTRAKIRAGEMRTWSLEEAKAKINARNKA